jgi:hypothetical protein
MEEARRFIRYVIPGLAAILQLLVCCLLTVKGTDSILTLDGDGGGLALVAALFLASGGLGYICAVIYYAGAWGTKRYQIDHGPVLKKLVDEKALEMKGVDVAKLTVEEAWRVGTYLWWSRNAERTMLGNATRRADSLADVLHGHGATIIGTGLALLAWVVLTWRFPLDATPEGWKCFGLVLALIIWASSLAVQIANFRRMHAQVQGFINLTLARALLEGNGDPTYPKPAVVTLPGKG